MNESIAARSNSDGQSRELRDMPRYSKGAINVQLKGRGGTWKAVDQNDLGFLLWESELYGAKAKKILTDIEGNIVLRDVGSFTDFQVRALVSRYERMRNEPVIINDIQGESEEGRPAGGESADKEDLPEKPEEIKRPEKRKAATSNTKKRESVISKLREYQEYVEKRKHAEKK